MGRLPRSNRKKIAQIKITPIFSCLPNNSPSISVKTHTNSFMKYYSLILGLLAITAISCSDLSTIKDYNDDGSLYRTYQVDKDSLIQGNYLVYYEGDNKKIFEQANYVDGKLHGDRVLYYDDGTPEIRERYIKDVLVDTLKVFYPSGEIKRKASYDNGVLSGSVQSYYEDGTLKEEATFVDNLENGPFTEYHPNGLPKWKGNFLNGDSEFGELLQYNEQGVLVRKMMCDSNAVCNTFWTLEKGDL